jgi:hypothetical protein
VLALLFIVSLPAVTARLYSSDEVQYFSYLRSLYFDHDVSFENEYRYFHDRNIAPSAGFHETFLERETTVGRRVNYGTIGAAMLWLPFYAVADLCTRAAGTAEANGFTQPYIAAVAYGSAFYAFVALLLSVRAARMVIGEHSTGSMIAALAMWFGTPLLFYMYIAPPFSHACSAFAVALFVNVWLHVRRTWSPMGTFALGLSAALMAMVREQDAFIAIGPLLDFARAAGAPRAVMNTGLLLKSGSAGLVGFVLAYAPQLLAYNAINGYPGPAAHVSRKMSWYAPHALQVIASPEHGFFLWTPLAVLAVAGLFLLRDRWIAICLLVIVISQVYVAGSVESWTVAGAFGQRRFVCLTVILVIGLAALWNWVSERVRQTGTSLKYAAATLVALCVWWNVALMAQFATRLMDRQRLEPTRNAYHAFVTLPLSVPSLAYRYLTDRGSFYEPRPGGASR